MLCDTCNFLPVNEMRGRSGRLVIEIDPQVKRTLYAKLATNGMTLKEWFLEVADRYIHDLSLIHI